MSYTQGTTHYNFPQISGTDRPTFADANEAFRTLDTKIYSLEGSATDVGGRLDTAEGNIVQLQSDVHIAQGTADLAKTTADTALEEIGITNTNVSQLTTRVGNKFDSVGIADPYDTAATYTVGDVITYNGQRYRCTTAVTVAEPFDVTKWTGEDVETVLDEIKSDLSNLNTGNNQKITRKYIKASNVSISPSEYVFTNEITRNGIDIKAIHGTIKYSNNFYPLSYNDGNFGFAVRIVDSGTSIKLLNATGPISVDIELVVDFVYTT